MSRVGRHQFQTRCVKGLPLLTSTHPFSLSPANSHAAILLAEALTPLHRWEEDADGLFLIGSFLSQWIAKLVGNTTPSPMRLDNKKPPQFPGAALL